MPKLPVVSGDQLIKLLLKLGYEIVRQRGSHVRLRKTTEVGEHNITVPNINNAWKIATFYANATLRCKIIRGIFTTSTSK